MVTFLAAPLPQLGPNDLSATILEWTRSRGDLVKAHDTIAMAETSKAVFEIESPATGYLYPLIAPDAEARVGQIVAVISDATVADEDVAAWLTRSEPAHSAASPSRRATLKAEVLAKRHSLDVTDVPSAGELVTEADVLAYIGARRAGPGEGARDARDGVDDRYPAGRTERLLIIGGGDGAVQLMDALARVPRQRAVAILDDNSSMHGRTLSGVPVVGGVDSHRALDMLSAAEIDAAVISVTTSISFRAKIFEDWRSRGVPFANVIHPSAVCGGNVAWGIGNVVLAFCHIGPCATIGNNNFLSAYCSIEHHSILGSHCSFGPSVVTSSSVNIGDRVRFGTSIFMEPHVSIGADAIVGSGCIIWRDVAAGSVLKTRLNYTERPRPDLHLPAVDASKA